MAYLVELKDAEERIVKSFSVQKFSEIPIKVIGKGKWQSNFAPYIYFRIRKGSFYSAGCLDVVYIGPPEKEEKEIHWFAFSGFGHWFHSVLGTVRPVRQK